LGAARVSFIASFRFFLLSVSFGFPFFFVSCAVALSYNDESFVFPFVLFIVIRSLYLGLADGLAQWGRLAGEGKVGERAIYPNLTFVRFCCGARRVILFLSLET
jgi:hypothetical protein